jgi:hypothetical protein
LLRALAVPPVESAAIITATAAMAIGRMCGRRKTRDACIHASLGQLLRKPANDCAFLL